MLRLSRPLLPALAGILWALIPDFALPGKGMYRRIVIATEDRAPPNFEEIALTDAVGSRGSGCKLKSAS